MLQAPAEVANGQSNGEVDERSPLLSSRTASKDPRRWLSFLGEHAWTPLPEFDSSECLPASYIVPLLLQCVITGLADASTFSLTRTWVGFMTGNMVQTIINAFDFWLPSASNTNPNDEEARTKLISNLSAIGGFMLGCQITARIIKRLRTERSRRMVLVAFSLYRSLATLALILAGMWLPSLRLQASLGWLVHSVLAASLGCQSTYSTSLATPFSNTVVFTATLTAVSSDLHLPRLKLDGANRFKLLSIVGLLSGGALSQVVLKVATKASKRSKHEAVQHALILLAGMELLLGLSWFLCGVVASWKRHRRQSAAHGSVE